MPQAIEGTVDMFEKYALHIRNRSVYLYQFISPPSSMKDDLTPSNLPPSEIPPPNPPAVSNI